MTNTCEDAMTSFNEPFERKERSPSGFAQFVGSYGVLITFAFGILAAVLTFYVTVQISLASLTSTVKSIGDTLQVISAKQDKQAEVNATITTALTVQSNNNQYQ